MAMRRYRMGRASLLILLLGLSLGMLIEGIALARAGAHNRTIERLLAGEDIPVAGDPPAEVAFARAHWLMQRDRGDEAIAHLRQL